MEKLTTTSYDDIDRANGIETIAGVRRHPFELDGRGYVIDVTDKHWEELTARLLRYAERTGAARKRTAATRAQAREIRQWADAHPEKLDGRTLEPRGRIPARIVELWEQDAALAG